MIIATLVGLREEMESLAQQVQATVNRVIDDTGREIGQLSPVDTGFFRFNWNLTYGAPSSTVRGERAAGRQFGPPTFGQVQPWFVTSGNIYFANAVDYAVHLDAGSSSQAPQGVTDPVATIIEARYARTD